jgi:hypothetical protein
MTMKDALRAVFLFLGLSAAAQAQGVKPAAASDARPRPVTLSVIGKCDYAADGVTFAKLERGQSLAPGAVVRTGEEARIDLFFRRAGATVRLPAGSEIEIEKMALTVKDGHLVAHNSLDLRAGRILLVVRAARAGSAMEIKNAAGRSVVEGSGLGKYIITADGTHVSAQGSVIPLKLISENGINIITAGQEFDKKEGKMLPVNPDLWAKEIVQLDELQSAAERLSPGGLSPKWLSPPSGLRALSL